MSLPGVLVSVPTDALFSVECSVFRQRAYVNDFLRLAVDPLYFVKFGMSKEPICAPAHANCLYASSL